MIRLKLSEDFVKKFKKTFPDLPQKICKDLDEGDYLTLNIFLTSTLQFPEWPKGTEKRYKKIQQLKDELHTFDFDPATGRVHKIIGYDQNRNPIWEKVKNKEKEEENKEEDTEFHNYIHGSRY